MRYDALVRMGGIAAMLAGFMRIGVEFVASGAIPALAPEAGAPLYPWIDACIAIAFAALMRSAHFLMGIAGWIGFALVMTGVFTIRATAYVPDTNALYAIGAVLTLTGTTVFGAVTWRRGLLRAWIGGFWIAALVAAIASLGAGAHAPLAQQMSAGFFGLAMIGLGAHLAFKRAV